MIATDLDEFVPRQRSAMQAERVRRRGRGT
jgi:hypothetical protein